MLKYREMGQSDGEPVVLWHGFCEDTSALEPLAQALAERYRVWLPVLPGFERPSPNEVPEYTLEDLADGLAVALDHAGCAGAVVAGHSMGGYVSLVFAERHPERVRGLGLLHSHPYADTPEKRKQRLQVAEGVHQHGAAAYIRTLVRGLFGADYARHHADELEAYIQAHSHYSTATVAAAARAMAARPDRSGVLAALEVPVLLFQGEQDTAVPPATFDQAMALPVLGHLHLLPGVGHMGMLECPEALQQAVLQWLEHIALIATMNADQ